MQDDDGVVGFAQGIWDPETGGPFSVDWGVALAHDLDAVGAALLTWCERQRDDREVRDPIRTSIVAEDDRARALLEGRGYVQVRLMWDMVRSLGAPQDLDVDPDGVEVRTFRAGQDEQLLYRIDETAFRDHWDHVDRTYEAFAARMFGESWDPSLAFLAEVDGEPAGELVAIADEGRGLDRLGRRPPRSTAAAAPRRPCCVVRSPSSLLVAQERVELSVDATSPTGAVALYEGMGMHVARSYAIFDGPAG